MEKMSTNQFLCCGHLFTTDNAGCITSTSPLETINKVISKTKNHKKEQRDQFKITHASSSSGVASGNRSFMFEVIFL